MPNILSVFVLDSNTQIEPVPANDVATKITLCDEDSFPVGSIIEVYWPGEKLWYTADVLETRAQRHREIYCKYRLDGHLCWHSLHNNKIRMAGDIKSVKKVVCQNSDGIHADGDRTAL